MSKEICIPCLNLKFFRNDYTIHEHTTGQCFYCGKERQGLRVTLGDENPCGEITLKNKYTFYWLTGKREVLEGETPEDALSDAGYGAGALPALDFFAVGDDNRYRFLHNQWTALII